MLQSICCPTITATQHTTTTSSTSWVFQRPRSPFVVSPFKRFVLFEGIRGDPPCFANDHISQISATSTAHRALNAALEHLGYLCDNPHDCEAYSTRCRFLTSLQESMFVMLGCMHEAAVRQKPISLVRIGWKSKSLLEGSIQTRSGKLTLDLKYFQTIATSSKDIVCYTHVSILSPKIYALSPPPL